MLHCSELNTVYGQIVAPGKQLSSFHHCREESVSNGSHRNSEVELCPKTLSTVCRSAWQWTNNEISEILHNRHVWRWTTAAATLCKRLSVFVFIVGRKSEWFRNFPITCTFLSPILRLLLLLAGIVAIHDWLLPLVISVVQPNCIFHTAA